MMERGGGGHDGDITDILSCLSIAVLFISDCLV